VVTSRGFRDPRSPEEAKEMIIDEVSKIQRGVILKHWADRIEERWIKIEDALNKAFSAVEKCDFRELVRSFDETEEAIGCGLPVYKPNIISAPSVFAYDRKKELEGALKNLNAIMSHYYNFMDLIERRFEEKCGESRMKR